MKKTLLLTSLFISGLAVFAQNGKAPAMLLNDASITRPTASGERNMTCNADTLRYGLLKEYTFNATPQFFARGLFAGEAESQAFISPGTVNVIGVNFRARSNSGAATQAKVYLYSVDAAFMPVTPLDSATVTVSTTTVKYYSANFPTPHTITGNYAVAVKANGTARIDFVSNNRGTGTGGEGLGYNLWDPGAGNAWFANADATNGWNKDFDSDISPIVTYAIATDYTVSPASNVCIGTPMTFTNTTSPANTLSSRMYNYNVYTDYFGTAAVADSTYAWDMGNASPIIWSQNASYTYPAAGTYTATLYTLAGFWNSCTDTKATSIVVSAMPVLTVTNPAPACGSADITAAAVTAGSTNTGTLSYWTDAAATMSLSTPAAVTVSGTYYIKAVNGACQTVASVSVSVTPNDDATITAPSAACSASSAFMLTAPTAGGTWSGTGVSASGSFDPAAAGSGTHTITYTTSGTCPDTDMATIIVSTTPVLMITNPAAACGSADLTASAITAGSTGGGTLTYWTDAAATVALATPSAVTASGTYYIKADNASCNDIEPVTVSVTANDDATITAPASVCSAAAPVTLTAPTTGGTWSGTGVSASGVFDPSVAGVGTSVVTYTTNGVCPDTDNASIIVTLSDDVTVTGPSTVCEGSSAVTLTAPTAGGTWTGTGVSASGSFDPTVSGVGSFTITYATSGACSNTDDLIITVNAMDDATITATSPVCESASSFTLSAATTGGTWTGTGVTATGTFDPSVSGAGSHTVTYTSAGVCPDSDMEIVIVNADDDATITATSPVCESASSFTLSAVTTGGTWTGTGVNATGTFDPSVSGVGTHTVTYTTMGVCPDMDTETIVVNATEDAAITAPAMVCFEDAPMTLTAATAGGTWTGSGITNASAGTFDPAAAGAGTTSVTYTTAGTCSASSTVSIVVSICTGIEKNIANSISVYPNPSNGMFTLNLGHNVTSTVEVYNVLGAQVSDKSFNTQINSLDLTGLEAGVYFVKVTTEKGQITKKINITK
ncbi:MAG: hypothetical protein K0Q95_304 [Bacteroidota bacterium]|jgi:hypothetical protein|nr:hypothetical protein [Bacteroidota bacterium]